MLQLIGPDHRDGPLSPAWLKILRGQDALTGGQEGIEMRRGERRQRPAQGALLDVAGTDEARAEINDCSLDKRYLGCRYGGNTQGIEALEVRTIWEHELVGRKESLSRRACRAYPGVRSHVHTRDFNVCQIGACDNERQNSSRPLVFR